MGKLGKLLLVKSKLSKSRSFEQAISFTHKNNVDSKGRLPSLAAKGGL